jgi:hypothetical protein
MVSWKGPSSTSGLRMLSTLKARTGSGPVKGGSSRRRVVVAVMKEQVGFGGALGGPAVQVQMGVVLRKL